MAKKSKKPTKTSLKPTEALESKISVLESNPEAEVVEIRKENNKTTVHVKALIPFYDLEEKVQRGAGAEWEVAENRAELLKKLGIAIVL